jgi:hypothetical protein
VPVDTALLGLGLLEPEHAARTSASAVNAAATRRPGERMIIGYASCCDRPDRGLSRNARLPVTKSTIRP